MTQTWSDKGRVVPVTVLSVGPCVVTQVKTKEKDGYSAVQIGFGEKKLKRVTKPMKGHFKELTPVRFLQECRMQNAECRIGDREVKRGDVIDVSMFAPGDMVKITGEAKGKGFQGVVKRHHFHGHPTTHGHKDQERMPGAIGAGGVQHVFKGTRMAGRMGGQRVTVPNLEIIAVDKEKNQLTVKGAIPGARGGVVMIVGK